MRIKVSLITWIMAGVGCVSSLALAQATAINVHLRAEYNPVVNSEVPISASEAAFQLRINDTRAKAALSYKGNHYPKDSLLKSIRADANLWLRYLEAYPIRGVHVDALGTIMVEANHDLEARRQIDARLMQSDLRVADKAFTLFTAVKAFSNQNFPDRLSVAENYMKQLDALGPKTAIWRFLGHRVLQSTYYELGKSASVARHGEMAVSVIESMEYVDRRNTMYSEEGKRLYTELVEALSAQPDRLTRLRTINSKLLSGTVPPEYLIALDSNFARSGRGLKSSIQFLVGLTERIGTKGEDIQGNYWVNLTGPGIVVPESRTVPISRGKVTLLAVGSYTCPPCMASLAGMQRLQMRFPELQTVFATWTLGYIGNRLVETSEEADTLAQQFIVRNKITHVPISIWKGNKVEQDDDGIVPENAGPNLQVYPLIVKPTIYIFDGDGLIRRINLGGLDRDKEEQMARTIEFLLKESKAPVS